MAVLKLVHHHHAAVVLLSFIYAKSNSHLPPANGSQHLLFLFAELFQFEICEFTGKKKHQSDQQSVCKPHFALPCQTLKR